MLQIRIFTGKTPEEIEAQFNDWVAALPPGTEIKGIGGCVTPPDGGLWLKEVMYVLAVRKNGNIVVPQIRTPADIVN